MNARQTDLPHARRGFALPLAVLFSVVAATMVAVMLARQGTQRLAVARQIDSYGSHHLARGMSEVIQAWSTSVGMSRVAEMIADDGRAFTLRSGASALDVSLFDDQGTALGETAGLSKGSRELADQVLLRVAQAYGSEAKMHLRSIGPVAVSVNTAPEGVLAAAIDAVLEGEGTDALVREILRVRSRAGTVTREDLLAAFDTANIAADKRGALDGVITTTPIVWRVVVDPRQPGGRGEEYYEGQAVIAGGASAGDRAGPKSWKLDLQKKYREP